MFNVQIVGIMYYYMVMHNNDLFLVVFGALLFRIKRNIEI